MKHSFMPAVLTALLLCLSTLTASTLIQDDSTKKSKDPFTSSTFSGMKFRGIGPALPSGRIGDIAVDPRDRSRYFVAVASGGVWRTTNAGTTWDPVFDSEKSFSIGCVAIDPSNPHTVWVGSGENNSQRSVSYGDGVYRSDDGGKSWRNMGLRKSEHIGKILVHPKNSNVVYVAAQGPLWGPGGDRGLYKTTDGGTTWELVLKISENTGVTDVVMDPRDSQVLYAASYQRRRHVWTLINGGPESKVHKSTDGGASWVPVMSGLPPGDLGRIGLAISPVNPDYIYAIVEAAEGRSGFFRSTDRGASWEKRSDHISSSPQYYQEIVCDPADAERVYSLTTYLSVTDDGGKTFRTVGNHARHVDDHALWIDPADPRYLLVGGDGGIYESFDRGATWRFKENLPVTQFYRVSVDNSEPFYHVYGGTQDNNSLGGPSRTIKADGILSEDWFFTSSGDGFESQIDPVDPNIVYSQAQYGDLVRFDRRSGERLAIQPQPGVDEEPYRWNWDAPLLISPHAPTRLYFAANMLFRSDDRGNSWRMVSGDLTRRIDRNALPVMGRIWGADAVSKNASTSLYGNIVALDESPKTEGHLYVGTDDGLVQISENGGQDWRRIDRFPGVPETTYVSCLLASLHDARTVYAAFDNHKNADFKPYLLKSADNGRTWKSIAGDLPENGAVYAVAEDHVNPDLLFAGTEFGVFFTVNGGGKWCQLKGGLPTIAVRDIAIQRRENDLILATFGRGFYILDDYAPLRGVMPASLAKDFDLLPIRDALMYIPSNARGRRQQGETFFTAANPPFGATFTYYVREGFTSLKEKRKELEREAQRSKRTAPYPTIQQLREEELEQIPYLLFTVSDASGSPVRSLTSPLSKGLQRITWDLRYPLLTSVGRETDINKSSELLALPGEYSVTMSTVERGVATRVAGPVSFTAKVLGNATLPAEDRRALVAFQRTLTALQREVQSANQVARELKSRAELAEKAAMITPSLHGTLLPDIKRLLSRVEEALRKLNGDPLLAARNENQAPSIAGRMRELVQGQWASTSAPTPSQQKGRDIVAAQLAPVISELAVLAEKDVPAIERALDAAGAPWTPGRLPRGNSR